MADAPQYDPYAMTADLVRDPPVSLWAALKKIGPGIILAGSIVGSGELIVTTSLGAEVGYGFLWLILFSCFIKVFVQIELGRNAISSGLPTLTALNELPGPKLGAHWLVWWWFFMLLCSVSQLGGMTGAVGQSLNIGFPAVSESIRGQLESVAPQWALSVSERPELPWAFLTCLIAILLLRSGGYRRVETLTTLLVAGVTFITLVCVLALPATGFAPNVDDMLKGLLPIIPVVGVAKALGAFGITGVGASELYSYPYWCIEKGYARYAGPRDNTDDWVRRAKGWMRVLYLDAWVSMAVFTVATIAFYIMGASVLHPQGLDPKGSQMIRVLSEMYIGPFGKWTQVVFIIGAGLTLFKTLYVSAASHSRLVTDFFRLNGFVQVPDVTARNRWVSRLQVFFPIFALVLFLCFKDPRTMVIFGGMAQAATLPVISGATLYLRYRRTDPRLAPSWFSDLMLWVAFVSITAVSGYGVFTGLRDLAKALTT